MARYAISKAELGRLRDATMEAAAVLRGLLAVQARFLYAVAFACSCLTAPYAEAQDLSVCNAVLVRATSTSATFHFAQVANRLATELCAQDFKTHQEMRSFSDKGDIGIPLGEAVLGIKGNPSYREGDFRTHYKAQCNRVNTLGDAAFLDSSFEQQYSPLAYNAWSECVGMLAKARASKIFVAVAMQGREYTDFSLRILMQSPAAWPIRIQQVAPGQDMLSCKYGNEPLTTQTEIMTQEFVITCRKQADTPITAFIQTNSATADGVELPAKPAQKDQLQELREELHAQLSRIEAEVIPQSAVIAFASESCPPGWRLYGRAAGRVIVGAGLGTNTDQNSRSLSTYQAYQAGGEENHALTIREMPSHTHSVRVGRSHYRDSSSGTIAFDEPDRGPVLTTDPAGGGVPHNNMPPFVALPICIQE